jgi:hypothetical protein
VGIWPRGGITFLTSSFSDDDDDGESGYDALALSIEAPLVIAPVPHAAILFGPTLDLGLSGERSQTSQGMEASVDRSATDIGVQAGIQVNF